MFDVHLIAKLTIR